ncbi:MAG TPA: CBS domain-containing protein [Rhizomicrobium sp.]|nr:CBS domain-containing protein [Rhizomicrobium sp.]
MKVGEIMTKNCKLVRANDTIRHAAELMAEEDVGCLPVEENDRLVGVITDRDIVTRCVAQGKNGEAQVRDAMTNDIKYCFEDQEIEDLLNNMAEIQVRRIPVMNRRKRLVGIVSLSDAARSADVEIIGNAFCGVVMPSGSHAGEQLRH